MPSNAKTRQRSEYLKSGCKECKRRKIKCDEFRDPPPYAVRNVNKQGRDLCWQCTRLKKECVYPLKGEKVARVSRKVLIEKERDAAAAAAAAAASADSASGQLRHASSTHSLHYAPLPPHQGKPSAHGPPQFSHMPGHPVHAGPLIPPPPGITVAPPGRPLSGFPPQYTPSGSRVESEMSGPDSGPKTASTTTSVTSTASKSQRQPSPQVFVAELTPVGAPINGPQIPGYGPTLPMHNGPMAPAGNPPFMEFGRAPGLLPLPIGPMMWPESSQSYDPSDLALLASDLNKLVSDMMYDVDPKGLMDMESQETTPPTPTFDAGPSLDTAKMQVNSNDWIPRNVGLTYIDVRRPEERVFLQEFTRSFPTSSFRSTPMTVLCTPTSILQEIFYSNVPLKSLSCWLRFWLRELDPFFPRATWRKRRKPTSTIC